MYQAFKNDLISENQLINDEFEDYNDDVVINFKEPPSNISAVPTEPEPEPELISTVKAMKNLSELQDLLQGIGEFSKNASLTFREIENVLLKKKVDEKKQSNITDFFKNWDYIAINVVNIW